MQVFAGTVYEIKLHGELTLAVALEDAPDASFADFAPLFSSAPASGVEWKEGAFAGQFLDAREVHRARSSAAIAEKGPAPDSLLADFFRLRTASAVKGHYRFGHKKEPFREGRPIPYAGRVYDEREMVALADSALDFWLTAGRFTARFEKGLANYVGARKLLLANSGSSANLLAFSALTSPKLQERRLLPGDEVISVAAGFPSTITPILQNGCVPVFLDISLPTYNIDVRYLEEALSPRTKAVMLAHTLGNPFDLSRIREFCQKNRLWLIEDNCDALGTEYFIDGEWKKTGSIGDLGTFSFYPPHHMTMGEGGAVCTSRLALEKIVLSFRDWGRDCWCDPGKDNTCGIRFEQKLGDLPEGYDHKYIYSHFGYNLKATDMQAAVGVAQLEKLPSFVAARIKNFQTLRDGLKDLEDIFILPEATANSRPSWFGFLITVKEGARFSRNQIVAELESRKIQTRMLFAGNFLRHPSFDEMRASGRGYRVIGDLKVTDQVMNHTFWVGVYPGRTQDELAFMIDTIRKFARR